MFYFELLRYLLVGVCVIFYVLKNQGIRKKNGANVL